MSESLQKNVTLGIYALVSRLPDGARRFLARLSATLAWHVHGTMRRVTETNLALCYPHMTRAEQQQLAKESLYHTIMTALEIPQIWTQPTSRSLQRISDVQGQALIDAARAEGNGVIIIAPHLGNWEYLGAYLASDYPMTTLYKPPRQAWLEEISLQGRSKAGGSIVPTNKKGVLAVLKTLKSGGITGILPDQIPEKGSGVAYVPLFGQTTATMTLIPSLLQRGNIVAVAGAALRQADGRFRIVLQAVPQALYSEDETIAAAALNQTVEQLVALAPAQYQWEYKRFRRGADGKKQKIY